MRACWEKVFQVIKPEKKNRNRILLLFEVGQLEGYHFTEKPLISSCSISVLLSPALKQETDSGCSWIMLL